MTIDDPEALFAAAPTPLRIPEARERIRASHAATGRRIGVLDDDPTGSQAVHGVAVVTEVDPEAMAAGLSAPGATCFVLTNSRSLSEADAVALTTEAARALAGLAQRLDAPVDVVSRSDSTLRGHVIAEVRALEAVRRDLTGRGYDGILFAPGYFEAGRVTAGDVHWAKVDGDWVPVGETEFARDATFGYASSDLRAFLEERSGGAVTAADVCSIALDDIRAGGPERVAELLCQVEGGAFVLVNGTEYADFEVVVLGLLEAEGAGRSFAYRSGPSFVRALAGIEPKEPLTAAEVFPDGHPGGHGLVVVGSHVGLTSRQVEVARERAELATVELDVAQVTDPDRRNGHVADTARQIKAALAEDDVLLYTSRTPARGTGADDSLDLARAVSAAVVEVVRRARPARPAWVVAKGGITSHDVGATGLEIRRAEVLGQLGRGIVSVLRPVDAAPETVGVPYVVFAGNVGDEGTLAHVIDVLDARD